MLKFLAQKLRSANPAHGPDVEALLAERAAIERRMAEAEAQLAGFPRDSALGLPSDSVRTSPEYRAAKGAFDRAFQDLRAFNTRNKKHLKLLRTRR